MNIPRYWAKSTETFPVRSPIHLKTARLTCWGWSDASASDAVARGNQRARAIAAAWPKGEYDARFPPKRYSYADRPLHEEVLDEWKNDAGETWAAITRNSYGCDVLNTATIMFVDVDLPEIESPRDFFAGILKRFFGGSAPRPEERAQEDALGKLRATVANAPGFGVRVYRTRRGLRYLMTRSHVQPDSEVTRGAMVALGADPKYVILCKSQSCFRARLTPKPWRCGMRPLRFRYPWDESKMHQVRMWHEEYSRKAADFATCALVEQLGDPANDPQIARVVEFHDRMTRVGSNLRLA